MSTANQTCHKILDSVADIRHFLETGKRQDEGTAPKPAPPMDDALKDFWKKAFDYETH